MKPTHHTPNTSQTPQTPDSPHAPANPPADKPAKQQALIGTVGAMQAPFAQVEAVLFDMDGVLADSESFYVRRRSAYLEGQGIHCEFGPDFVGISNDLIWQKIVPDDAALRARLQEGYERYSQEHPANYAEIGNPQAKPIMEHLRAAGIKTGICSSSFPEMVAQLVEELGLGELLDLTLTGWEVEAFKPHPAIYLRAMERLGVAPERTLVVEDSSTGIAAGKAAGATVVALTQFAQDPKQDEADLKIAELSELAALIGLD